MNPIAYVRRLFAVDRRVLVLALARAVDSLGNSFLIIVLPLYIADVIGAAGAGITVGVAGIDVTLAQSLAVGIVLSMFGFLNSFGQPFTGRWSDRVGKRRAFVLFGLAVLAVTNVAYAFAGNYVSLFVIRAVQGFGVAFTVPATIALVNELATDDTRGNNMGVFNTFRLLGFGLGPIVAGGLVHGGPYALGSISISGYNAAFAIAAGGALLSLVLVALLVTDPERVEADAGDDLSIAVLDHERDEKLLDPVFTLGLASLFMAIGIALISAIEADVNARLDQTAFLFGIEFAAFVLAQVLLQAPIGSASDDYGRKPFVFYGLLLLAPSTAVQGFVTEPWMMIVARFVQGIAGAAVFAPALALAGDYARAGQSGTQLSVLTMAFGLGVAIGPLASGALATIAYAAPFVLGGLLALLGAVLVYTQVSDTVKPGEEASAPSGAAGSD
ncbi:MFS transporter [Halarchaeum nitratireducens]|uniref:MFS transporter n=1 Tax=Halarchaeum nitratireducens TaxID=489913 RepID=A0A830GB63_9EURY|nr:MFS transporter [Halarchaeum nitratireducens]GGN16938.1 MFS transporter [Halarchaeum nitratireducens]